MVEDNFCSFNLELLGNYQISSVPGHCEAEITWAEDNENRVKLGISFYLFYKFMVLCTYIWSESLSLAKARLPKGENYLNY